MVDTVTFRVLLPWRVMDGCPQTYVMRPLTDDDLFGGVGGGLSQTLDVLCAPLPHEVLKNQQRANLSS